MTKLAAQMGLAFAIALTVIETVHNWGSWSDPAMWIIDYFACAMLYAGSYLVLHRRHIAGPALVAAGWSFSCAMFWMAYFRIRDAVLTSIAPTPDDLLVLNFAGGLFLWTIVGMAISITAIFTRTDTDAQP